VYLVQISPSPQKKNNYKVVEECFVPRAHVYIRKNAFSWTLDRKTVLNCDNAAESAAVAAAATAVSQTPRNFSVEMCVFSSLLSSSGICVIQIHH